MPSDEAKGLPSVLPRQAEREGPFDGFRPLASFVAHLIATAQGAPQTRARHRAGEGHAAAVYTAARRQDRPRVIERLL